jgi:hypothetical protein
MTDRPDVFPAIGLEDVALATAKHWDLSGPYPVPVGDWLACPVCRCDTIQGQSWTRHVQPDKGIVGRVDVRFKCTSCAASWVHGVAVPADYSRRHSKNVNRHVPWREVRAALEKEKP